MIIIIILAAALTVWGLMAFQARRNSGLRAEIYCDGVLVKTVRMDEPQTFSIDGLPNVVFDVSRGGIAFISSDCPDKVCVNTGRLSAPGDFAACLPNKTTLWITGGSDVPEPDITVK